MAVPAAGAAELALDPWWLPVGVPVAVELPRLAHRASLGHGPARFALGKKALYPAIDQAFPEPAAADRQGNREPECPLASLSDVVKPCLEG